MTAPLDLMYQYALAVAGEADDFRDAALSPIHLLKYAYLGDLAYAEQHGGQTFSGIEWTFYHFGPWSIEAYRKIEPALSAVGAVAKRVPSKYQENRRVWKSNRRELRESLDPKLPFQVARSIRLAVQQFGTDTVSLLHHVYRTAPMLRAAPGEILTFRPEGAEPERDAQIEAAARKTPAKLSKTKVKKLKASIQEKLRKKRAERAAWVEPTPAPRYDEVFERGVRWLEELAGDSLRPVQGSLTISPEVWHSQARREPELS